MADAIFDGDPTITTLADAKDWLRVRGKKGARCPCCRQHVEIYRRVLGSQMARWLIWLVRTWEHQGQGHPDKLQNTWIDIRQAPVRGGDYAKLRYWSLVEQKTSSRKADERDIGLWRPTYKGIDFVYRRVSVPSHVYVYDEQPLKFEERTVSVVEALGKRFSYQELMSAPVHIQVPV